MNSLAAILNTVGGAATELMDPTECGELFGVVIARPIAELRRADPLTSGSIGADDDDEIWLLQQRKIIRTARERRRKRRLAAIERAPFNEFVVKTEKIRKLSTASDPLLLSVDDRSLVNLSSQQTADTDHGAKSLSDSSESTSTVGDEDRLVADVFAHLRSCGAAEHAELLRVPRNVIDDLHGVLGPEISLQTLMLGVAMLTADAGRTAAQVGSGFGVGSKRVLNALQQLCCAIERKRAQLIRWPADNMDLYGVGRNLDINLDYLCDDLKSCCGVLLRLRLAQLPTTQRLRIVCNDRGQAMWADCAAHVELMDFDFDAAGVQLPERGFLLAPSEHARLADRVLVPVERSDYSYGGRLTYKQRRYNIAVRSRVRVARTRFLRLLVRIPRLSERPESDEANDEGIAATAADNCDFGVVSPAQFVLAAVALHNLCTQYESAVVNEFGDETFELDAATVTTSIKEEPLDIDDDDDELRSNAGSTVSIRQKLLADDTESVESFASFSTIRKRSVTQEPLTKEQRAQEEAGRRRRSQMIQTM